MNEKINNGIARLKKLFLFWLIVVLVSTIIWLSFATNTLEYVQGDGFIGLHFNHLQLK